jgi:hypothetical protein
MAEINFAARCTIYFLKLSNFFVDSVKFRPFSCSNGRNCSRHFLTGTESAMSTSGSNDDDSINDVLAVGSSITPTPAATVVETTTTSDDFLGKKPRAHLLYLQVVSKKGTGGAQETNSIVKTTFCMFHGIYIPIYAVVSETRVRGTF